MRKTNFLRNTVAIAACLAVFTINSCKDWFGEEEDDPVRYGSIISSGQLSYKLRVEAPAGVQNYAYKAPINMTIDYDVYNAVRNNPDQFSSMSGNINSLLQGLGLGDISSLLGGYEGIIDGAYSGVPIIRGGNYKIKTNPDTGEPELDLLNTLPFVETSVNGYIYDDCSYTRWEGYLSEAPSGGVGVTIYMKPDGKKFKYQVMFFNIIAMANGQPILPESWVFTEGYIYCPQYKYDSTWLPMSVSAEGMIAAYLQNINFNAISEDINDYFGGNLIEIPADEMESFLADPEHVKLSIPLDASQTINGVTITVSGWSAHNAELPEVECELTTEESYQTWLPEGGNSETEPGKEKLHITVNLYKAGTNKKERPIQECDHYEIRLLSTTKEPGVCNNYPLNGKEDYDLKIEPNDKLTVGETGQSAKSNQGGNTLDFYILSYDYGAYADLEVTAVMTNNVRVQAYINGKKDDHFLEIPRDDNNNLIADAWEDLYPSIKGKDPMWDEDAYPAGQACNGDGYTLYEEYRGFRTLDSKEIVRTDPTKKDLFVYDMDGLVKLYYEQKGNNPAQLVLHYVDDKLIPYKDESMEPDDRRVNFNSATLCLRPHYAMVVKKGGVSTAPDGADDVGGAVFNTHVLGSPMRRYFIVKIYEKTEERIFKNLFEGKDPNHTWQEYYEDDLAATVIHEMGHCMGIKHHGNDKQPEEDAYHNIYSGVINCSIRYLTKYENTVSTYVWQRYIYCKNDDNCWGQINVSSQP